MEIGLLYYCDDKKLTLEEKVQRAVAFYIGKYTGVVNVCYVNPSMLEGGKQITIGNVKVKPSKTVVTNHFWLGDESGNDMVLR